MTWREDSPPSQDDVDQAQRQFDINKARVLAGDTFPADRDRNGRRLGRPPSSYDRHGGHH